MHVARNSWPALFSRLSRLYVLAKFIRQVLSVTAVNQALLLLVCQVRVRIASRGRETAQICRNSWERQVINDLAGSE